jgi:hypothetical protein
LNLTEVLKINRKSLISNQKRLATSNGGEPFVFEVGATGFEPDRSPPSLCNSSAQKVNLLSFCARRSDTDARMMSYWRIQPPSMCKENGRLFYLGYQAIDASEFHALSRKETR